MLHKTSGTNWGGGGGGGGGGGLNLLGDEFNLKHEIVVVKEISHKSNLLCCFGQKYNDKTSFVCHKK